MISSIGNYFKQAFERIMDFYADALPVQHISRKLFLEQVSGNAFNVSLGARPPRERELMFPWRALLQPPGRHAETDTRSGLASMHWSLVPHAA